MLEGINSFKLHFNRFKTPTTFAPYFDINDEITSISSIPVPFTNEVPISNWSKEHCVNAYRPTPEIEEELLSNARVIHGITSVPNRNGMKHYLQLNESYQECLNKFEERSKQTSFLITDTNLENATVAATSTNKSENNTTLQRVAAEGENHEEKKKGNESNSVKAESL